MTEDDLDSVLEIERESFASPWRHEHFLFEIRQNRWAVNRVVRLAGQVVAYMAAWELDDELKINNIAVRAEQRRRGLGRWLLRRILAEARARGCRWASLEVRPSNGPAKRLYEEHGFREVGRRRGYYQQEFEDAIVMEAEL